MEEINDSLIRFAKVTDELYDLYAKKNKNYGNSFGETWEKLGPISGLTRLHDKLNRATSLVCGCKNNFESLEDTFIDMANYSIMCVVELRKEKELAEQAERINLEKYQQQVIEFEKAKEEKPKSKSKKILLENK